jgi:penicillin-binding protein 2
MGLDAGRGPAPWGKGSAGEGERAWRAAWFGAVAVASVAVLVARLAQLQLREGDHFRKQAEGNRLRIIPHPAPRGVIRDRHGEVLASNRLAHALVLYPAKMSQARVREVIVHLAELLGLAPASLQARAAKAPAVGAHPIRLLGDLDQRQIAIVAEHLAELPGVAIEPDAVRFYPQGLLAAHVLGYTGEATDADLLAAKGRLRPGEVLGKAGLERALDGVLRGTAGSQNVEVDARGRPVKVLGHTPPVPGRDLTLTLDARLQRAAEAALDAAKVRGAVVALDPRDGSVLALASRPAYNPNLFSRRVKAAEWKALQALAFPFVNRALSAFPPGSIYKVAMAMAAQDSGRCPPGRTFYSSGSLQVGSRVFHDWNPRGFGTVDLVKSLQWSIDTVYYQLGVEMGGEVMAKNAHRLGLGERTGILIGPESAGLIPDPAWKRRVFKDRWWPGDSANVAIGQGAMGLTPLQAATMISAIANGGTVWVPRLVQDGQAPVARLRHPWKAAHLATVRRGLRAVVTSGTGGAAAIEGVAVAGKTGSAESGKPKTHAWFVGYAPFERPTIALCAFAETAGHGGEMAAPMVRRVLEAAFRAKGAGQVAEGGD